MDMGGVASLGVVTNVGFGLASLAQVEIKDPVISAAPLPNEDPSKNVELI